ncbi:MAG: glycosyl transferase, partial [Lachnospiraceae bacterium]|nr:glycosyl transferase [Lachnospiraceae bacterium]
AKVIISCGNAMDLKLLGTLPDNISVYPYVDQLDVLSRADVFITHCGMNSVSESLYMAAPMILYPQTGEQRAVARRVTEVGAGILLRDDSSEGIRIAVQEILNNTTYAKAASECSLDFRACSGATGAAEFIENAPHQS